MTRPFYEPDDAPDAWDIFTGYTEEDLPDDLSLFNEGRCPWTGRSNFGVVAEMLGVGLPVANSSWSSPSDPATGSRASAHGAPEGKDSPGLDSPVGPSQLAPAGPPCRSGRPTLTESYRMALPALGVAAEGLVGEVDRLTGEAEELAKRTEDLD